MKTITICGGGSLGHVIGGWLAAKGHAKVNILTNHPDKWKSEISIETPNGDLLNGVICKIDNNPQEIISEADVVLFCLPGFLIRQELLRIKPFLNIKTYVGCVFSSTGFFFEAKSILSDKQPLWGFQRVPFISRVEKYGSFAHLLGYKSLHKVSVENVSYTEKIIFVKLLQKWFESPVKLLNNFYEASLSNSNPLLHTARLYTMFGGKNEGRIYARMILFYKEWTEEAADIYIKMDEELFKLLKKLPVSDDFLPSVLAYYESVDAKSLACKLSSIQGFKCITSPMKQIESGWIPDFDSRYFKEDFPYGLRYIWKLAHENGICCPTIDKVYQWGIDKLNCNRSVNYT